MGRAENPSLLKGEAYDEEVMEPLHLETNDLTSMLHLYTHKLILCYQFGEIRQAVEHADKLEAYIANASAMPVAPPVFFFNSLARLASYPEASDSEKETILEKVAANQERLKIWAEHAPMNYAQRFHLVEAERARVLGLAEMATDLYDQAIDLAHAQNYLGDEALAYELAGKFYLAKGQTRLAHYYLHDAYYAYRRRGTAAKVKDLEERYPQLFTPVMGTATTQTAVSATTTTNTKAGSSLDLASVLKASQAISGEIELGRLLTKLMQIVIENAGAQRGFLLQEKKEVWVIEAEGTIKKAEADGEPEVTALQSIPGESNNKLSTGIVNFVARTRDNVVLNNAAQDGLFTQDPYVIQQQPKSILCMPLINQGKLTGILYLENNLTTDAFTADRLEVLNLLSAQAAISIENASLYSHQVALTKGYSRFVPPEFLRYLNKGSIVDIELGDHVQQEMAVLFSDIRSFTTLSETMTPQENFDFVNAYFGRVSPVIRQHNGIIVKYLGDGMMAVFPRQVEDALNAAIAKVKQVDDFNQDRQQRGEVPIRIGIGIHTGKMMLGTVGEPERMQSDFLSDAVNLTARLEGLTKLYGASIVISQEALNRIEDPTQYQLRFLDRVQVKGRLEAVAVFEALGGEPEAIIELKLQTKSKFEEGLTFYYDQKFAEAGELFNHVLKHNPDDRAAKLYLERSEHYRVHGAPVDWAGVRVLDKK
jgi:class 3 adenylate cyclase/GAF domain-containing protein